MAAGDVVIVGDIIPDVGGSTGDYRLLWGTVTLDGGNPTPIALANYVQSVDFAVVGLEGSTALGDDPNQVTSAVSTTTVNVYAWKNVSGTDPTYVASTDNARLVNWFAVGPKL